MRLFDWLKQNNLSQEAFAERVGVTQGRISQIVQGASPSLNLMAKINEATGGEVTPNDFLALVEAAE